MALSFFINFLYVKPHDMRFSDKRLLFTYGIYHCARIAMVDDHASRHVQGFPLHERQEQLDPRCPRENL